MLMFFTEALKRALIIPNLMNVGYFTIKNIFMCTANKIL